MNVIVLEASGLHLGYLGCYGAEGTATPAIDRLAAEGVVFDQHFADCPAARVRTSWTGRYEFPEQDQREPALTQLLSRHGIAVEVVHAVPASDLASRLSTTLNSALTALGRLTRAGRWFLWLELPAVAPPWDGPPMDLDDEQLDQLEATYAEMVELFDSALGKWREEWERRGGLDQALLCLTARTGLALGEHGTVGPDTDWPHEEHVHLPLLLRFPAAANAGRRTSALTQPVDLAPTLLECFGLPVPADLHGRSLWPLLRGEAEQVRAYACAGVGREGRGGLLVRTPDWAHLRALGEADRRTPQLFAKPEDRWEVLNVLQLHEPWAGHLDQVLCGFVAAARQPGPLRPPDLRDPEAVLAESVTVPEVEPKREGGNP